MKVHGLIDTGAMLALLDADDDWHQDCVEAFAQLKLPLATTAAVLTELFHLMDPRELQVVWEFLRSEAVVVVPIATQDLPRLERLMIQYADRPMDFADATLVYLAEQLRILTILTVDHNDFETYRIEGRRPFQIVPPRQQPRK